MLIKISNPGGHRRKAFFGGHTSEDFAPGGSVVCGIVGGAVVIVGVLVAVEGVVDFVVGVVFVVGVEVVWVGVVFDRVVVGMSHV